MQLQHFNFTRFEHTALCGCPACGSVSLDPEDMASPRIFRPERLDALTVHYGGPVCSECADAAVFCDWCRDGVVTDEDNMASDGLETLRFCCASCMSSWAEAGE